MVCRSRAIDCPQTEAVGGACISLNGSFVEQDHNLRVTYYIAICTGILKGMIVHLIGRLFVACLRYIYYTLL